jgi:biopolymer transport protein ExbB
MEITRTLVNLSIGGNTWILLLLLLLSVLSVAFIIERLVLFRIWQKNSERLIRHVGEGLKEGRLESLASLNLDSPLSSLVSEALRTRRSGVTVISESLERERIRLRLRLEKRLNFLGTIGANAPFIGLLGTVIGIMHAFRELAEKGQGGEYVMAGISEALVATALGLFVAIPSAVFFNFFRKKVNDLLSLSEILTHMFLEYEVRYEGKD